LTDKKKPKTALLPELPSPIFHNCAGDASNTETTQQTEKQQNKRKTRGKTVFLENSTL